MCVCVMTRFAQVYFGFFLLIMINCNLKTKVIPGKEVHTYDLNTWQSEAREWPGQGHPELYSFRSGGCNCTGRAGLQRLYPNKQKQTQLVRQGHFHEQDISALQRQKAICRRFSKKNTPLLGSRTRWWLRHSLVVYALFLPCFYLFHSSQKCFEIPTNYKI